MFSLLSGCFEFMLRKEELHILIIGLDKAGKTTLLERLKTLYTDVPGLEADKVVPTVGLNLANFEVGGRLARGGGDGIVCALLDVGSSSRRLTPFVGAGHAAAVLGRGGCRWPKGNLEQVLRRVPRAGVCGGRRRPTEAAGGQGRAGPRAG